MSGRSKIERTTETTECIVCGSGESELISQKGQFNVPINVVACQNCGLTYLNPRWTKESYSDFYKTEYDRLYRPVQGSKRAGNSPYKNPILERLILYQHLSEKTQSILDIGSGEGSNLNDFQNMFPKANCFAIEPSTQSRKVLDKIGFRTITEDVESAWETEFRDTFDMVIMRHVLEHFMDPIAVLKKVHSVLKDSGIFYLAVPNSLSPTAPLESNWFRAPHTYYFNKYSINNLLAISKLIPLVVQEGDSFNMGEIFVIGSKSNIEVPLDIRSDHFTEQRNLFEEKLKHENSVIFRVINFARQTAARLLRTIQIWFLV